MSDVCMTAYWKVWLIVREELKLETHQAASGKKISLLI